MHMLCVILVLCSSLATTLAYGIPPTTTGKPTVAEYSVPKAEIRLLVPQGFSVSIPTSPGIARFEFHGNLNKNLHPNEPGTFSEEILHQENGVWTYKNTSTVLKVGDILNYWLYVEKRLSGAAIRGYRRDSQNYIVTSVPTDNCPPNYVEESATTTSCGNQYIPQAQLDLVSINASLNQCNSTIISGGIHYHHHSHLYSSDSQFDTPAESMPETMEKISNQLSVLLMQIKSLHEKTDPMRVKIDSMEEVIIALLNEKDNCNKLMLIQSNAPHDLNPYEAIRDVITDQLDLTDLNNSVKLAELVEGGILFEMKTSIEKERIFMRAQLRFDTAKRKIVKYECNKYVGNTDLPEIFVRNGDGTPLHETVDDDAVVFV